MMSLQHSSGRTVSRAAMFWSIWYLLVAPTREAVINGLPGSDAIELQHGAIRETEGCLRRRRSSRRGKKKGAYRDRADARDHENTESGANFLHCVIGASVG